MKRDGARVTLPAIILERVGTTKTAPFLSFICELQSRSGSWKVDDSSMLCDSFRKNNNTTEI